MDSSDQQLLERFLTTHDERAFEALLQRYAPMVMGICQRILGNSHDATDVFQAVFLVLAKKASSLKPKRSIGSWLYRVAVNTALTAKSRNVKRAKQEQLESDMHDYAEEDLGNKWSEIRILIDQELNRLPEKYRALVVFCDLQGGSYEEAANELGLTHDTVRMRLARARDRLRKRFSKNGIVLSSARLGTVIAQNASTQVPVQQIATTASAAAAILSGKTLANAGISTQTITLMKTTIKHILWKKVASAVTILALATSGSAGVAVISTKLIEGKAINLNQQFLKAAHDGDEQKISNLLDKGIDVNTKDGWDRSALFYALENGKLGASHLLISKGADLKSRTKDGGTSLMAAAAGNLPEMVDFLSAEGLEVTEEDKNGWTPLMYAARASVPEMAKFLESKGIDLKYENKYGATALMAAAVGGNTQMIAFLLEEGFKLNDEDNNGWTPLMYAARDSQLETVKFLIEKGASFKDKNKFGVTAFMAAAEGGKIATMEFLIKQGIDETAVDANGWTAAMHAEKAGALESAKFLANHRSNTGRVPAILISIVLLIAIFAGGVFISRALRGKTSK